MTWDRSQRNRRDERGSTLPMVSLILVTLLVSAALTIDLGLVAATNRRLQGVADLAAIAGANELIGAACNHSYTLGTETSPSTVFNHVRAAVVASAAKNSFPVGGTKSLVIEVGTITYATNGKPTFTSMHSSATGVDCATASVPTAVRVTAGDFTNYGFAAVIGREGQTTFRSGIASRKSGSGGIVGGFSIGSVLATVDSTESALLNSVLDGMVCPASAPSSCAFNLTAVGYNGLATSYVTLGQLQTASTVGSVNGLLNSEMTMSQFYILTAKALGCTTTAGCSNTAAVTLLNLSTTVNSTTKFKLAELITVASGGDSAAAAAAFNVWGLVNGTAQVMNGTNTVSIPSLTVSLPGVTSATMALKITELPKTYIGPVGGSVSTSQIELTVTPTVNLGGLILTDLLARVRGQLPVQVTAGSATGTLTQVSCGTDKGETVSVDTKGATTKIGTSVAGASVLEVKSVLNLTIATLNLASTTSVAGVNGTQVSFDYPAGYYPTNPTPTHVGGTGLNLSSSTSVSSSLSVVALGLNTTALTTALLGVTGTGLITTLEDLVISPLLNALGIDVAGADVWAIGNPGCGAPNLAG